MKKKNGFKTLSEFKPFLKNHIGLIIVVFILAILYVGSLLSVPIFMGLAINISLGTIYNYPLSSDVVFTFWLYIGLMIGLSLVSSICEYFFEYEVNVLSQLIVKEIRDSVFIKLSYLPISYIDNRSHGDMLSLATNDTENIMTGITAVFKQLLEGVITLITTLALMYYVNWILATVVLFLTPLSFFVSKTVKKNTNKHFKAQAKQSGELAGYTLERITNYKTVKTFNISKQSYDEFEKLDQDLYVVGQKSQFLSSWTNPSTRLVNNIVYAFIGLAGILIIINQQYLISFSQPLQIGMLSTFLSYALKFAKPFNDISSVNTEIQTAEASFKRVQALLDIKDESQEEVKTQNIELTSLKSINFKDIDFGYVANQQILKKLNLEIYSGHRVAIVGPTGCGKTTLINLLLRFYDPTSGGILLGNENKEIYNSLDIPKSKVRQLFGMVLQDTWIFNGTVKENICYAKPLASMEEIENAAKRAQADEFIQRLPSKYDTIISPTSGLSEGEKQLLSIARVLLMNPNMIILDEATSSLDAVSEKNITAAISELSQNKTTIVIAHRLQTIRNSDAIAVIMDGKIGEIGTHDELMKKKGFYYNMYMSQYQ